MKELTVSPHIGIGALKLGMTPEQILNAINEVIEEFSIPNNGKMIISEGIEEDGFTIRYLGNGFFFMVIYQNNQAVEISVNDYIKEYAYVTLYEKEVFNTSAEELVNYLSNISPCIYDLDDRLLSTNYEFVDIGVRLWREDAFHEKLLLDKKYMEDMSQVIDEMYRYLYFELIAIK